MAQWVKVLASKSNGLRSSSRSHGWRDSEPTHGDYPLTFTHVTTPPPDKYM